MRNTWYQKFVTVCNNRSERNIVLLLITFQGSISLPWFFWKYVARLVSWKFVCHSPKYVRMSALSESRRGPCISYLDFLINTDRSLFPQEDIRNDLHVIWFEAETRGILVEEGFRLITSKRFFLIVVRNTSYHNYTYFAQSSLYVILDCSTSCHC